MRYLLYFLTVIVFTIMMSVPVCPQAGEDKDFRNSRHDARLGQAHHPFAESLEKQSSFANPIPPYQRRDLNFQTKNVRPNRRLIGSGKNQFHQYKSADDLHSWNERFANDLITKNHTVSESTTDSFEIAWVQNYASGLISGNDHAEDIAVDANGNIYVTGITFRGLNGYDYTTIKYDAMGNVIWTSYYSGPGNSNDHAYALALDEIGNVYVTGSSDGSNGSADFTTIKYNSSGDTVWVRRYNGPGDSEDYAIALAVDGNDNVYVTGASYDGGTFYCDYTTIKYNSSGDTVWVRRYNGPGDSEDYAIALAVDGNGNVYVTGESCGVGTVTDYATIKYNSSGDTLWTRRYNGPGNGNDIPAALSVDGDGNVYVTGESYGVSTITDYATIKYNSGGDTVWVRRYNGPGNSDDYASAIAVDVNGNVTVTGGSDDSNGSSDYTTIKYNSSGDPVWVRRYNGPGNSSDYASAIAVDEIGNVFITGESYGIGTSIDYATIKYNSSGDSIWVQRYDGFGKTYDHSTSLMVDGSGNVYVSGIGLDQNGYSDHSTTIKFNSLGDTLWVRNYGSDILADNSTGKMTIDNMGNVYVAFTTYGPDANSNFTTIKYNSSGDTLWINKYNGPDNDDDLAVSLVADINENVYVTGRSNGSNGLADYATLKYNSSGDTLWTHRYNGPGNGNDIPAALTVDGVGNVYVTGESYGVGTVTDYVTIKYNSSGDTVWIRRYNYWGYDYASALTVDNNGNVYVTGRSYDLSTSSYDYATIKYNSSGDLIWVKRYNGPNNDDDLAISLATDINENVYVTGTSIGLNGFADYATVKYNSCGDMLWNRRYNGGINYDDEATSLAIDGYGNVYVAGGGSGLDYVIIKYNSAGEQVGTARYKKPEFSQKLPAIIYVDSSGSVYLTGTSALYYGQSIYTIIKYNQIPVSVKERSIEIPDCFSLEQNYPNPFNPLTVIRYQLPIRSRVTLKLYNVLGQEVVSLINEELNAGSHQVIWDASNFSSGFYFYQLSSESLTGDNRHFSQTRKMLLLR